MLKVIARLPISPIYAGLFLFDLALLLFTHTEREKFMQITLNQKEIESAIINFINAKGDYIQGRQTEITLIAGRGGNGMSATINVLDNDKSYPIYTPNAVTADNVATPPTPSEIEQEQEEESETDPTQMPLFGGN